MGFKDVVINVVTFGAHKRVQNAIENYNQNVLRLASLIETVDVEKENTKQQLKSLIEVKRKAVHSLSKINKIAKNLSVRERNFIELEIKYQNEFSFDRIQKTIDAGEIAFKGITGASAGVASAAGAWALAGWIGTASTGTAISTLSGVAATNATLAWLGGGALSAGGFGITGGTIVLGGIVTLPILLFTGVGAHISANKRIKEIIEKESEVIKSINECKSVCVALEALRKRSKEIELSIIMTDEKFIVEFKRIYRELYPLLFLSKIWRKIRTWFGKEYFKFEELSKIAYIGEFATNLAVLIDTPLIDEDGNIIENGELK